MKRGKETDLLPAFLVGTKDVIEFLDFRGNVNDTES